MQVETLINKFYLETLTPEETIFLLDYLKVKEPQHEILLLYKDKWDKAGEHNNEINSKKLFNKIVNEIGILDRGLKQVEESPKGFKFIGKVSPIMRYAAIFILAFGLSWLVYSYLWNKTSIQPVVLSDQIQTVEVPYGSKSRIVLPDGSVVNLNSGSSLKYSSSGFNFDSRSVFLTGEGFFSVTKDPARPFYVNTPGIKIKVLGTTFNVKAYLDENIEETTLVTGKVEIYSSSDKTEKDKAIVLKPNQKAVFIKSENNLIISDSGLVGKEVIPVKLQTVNNQTSSKIEQTISWKENRLVFDNEQFSSLSVKIERWYDVKITLDNPQLSTARFTGKFDKETLEQVLNALVTVTPFNYTIKQNLITISEK